MFITKGAIIALFVVYKTYIFRIIRVEEERNEKNYETVSNMISGKDLDYSRDIYNWNFNACKLFNHFVVELQDYVKIKYIGTIISSIVKLTIKKVDLGIDFY